MMLRISDKKSRTILQKKGLLSHGSYLMLQHENYGVSSGMITWFDDLVW